MADLRERQKEARRRRMLRAAKRLLQERGYAATTIEDVAELAGVSPATVFNYYKSKGDLLLALITDADTIIIHEAAALIRMPERDAAHTVCQYLERVTTDSLAYIDRESWRHLMAATMTGGKSDFRIKFDALRHKLIGEISHLIEVLMEADLLPRECRTDVLGRILYQIHHALFLQLIADEEMTVEAYRSSLQEESGHLLHLISGMRRARLSPATPSRI